MAEWPMSNVMGRGEYTDVAIVNRLMSVYFKPSSSRFNSRTFTRDSPRIPH
jgi:hypothetical protein